MKTPNRRARRLAFPARNRRGFALLLVIVVSVALMAIAIPFAISMRAQERGAHGTAERARARYSATAGRNHALAAVIRGHESLEEAGAAAAPFNTPVVDTIEEFQLRWDTVRAQISGPDGPEGLRGAVLQDEQAKINERTAPVAVVDRIKAKLDPRTTEARDFLTRFSGRPCAWAAPQTIRGVVPGSAPDGSPALTLYVDDASNYSEGARVRVSWAGPPTYGLVVATNPNGNDVQVTGIAESDSQVGAVLELECRHPININSASATVIAACLEGLGLRNKLTEDVVTAGEAEALAALMVKRKFATPEEFSLFLQEQSSLGTITQNDEVAILINAANPCARRLERTGTVPFSLQSYDYYTVASSGVRDLPSGAIGATAEMRQVVELAPAGTLRWRCRSQYDFERNLKLPLGREVVTWPACVANREPPSSDRAAGGWVTTKTGRDERGQWKIMNHFDNSLQGHNASRGAFTARAGQILQIVQPNVDIEAGATELWIKTSSTSFTVFDAGTEQWSNRLWMSYGYDTVLGGNALKFVVKDSTLERTYAQVTHLVTLTPDTWYHLGAFWKGTKFGHAMMTLDGLPVGQYGVMTEQGQSRHTTLATALSATDTTVVASGSVAGFQVPGVIEIGGEAIEYTGVSGSSFTGCVRGARGTAAAAHQALCGITVWGYTNKLVSATLNFSIPNVTIPTMSWDRLTTGGGALIDALGADTNSNVGPNPTPPGGPPGVPAIAFAQGATTLTIPSADVAKYPSRGWLTVGTEIIHYDQRTATGFAQIQRGLFGTNDVNHFEYEPVRLWGFHVTDNTNYLSPTVIVLDDEWIGPMMKEGADGWRGITASVGGMTIPVPLFRGNRNLFGTPAADHPAGTLVLPTFAVEQPWAGSDDTVTFVEQDPATREERVVGHSYWMPNIANASPNPPFALVACTSNVNKEWVADGRWVRILKFPSGELMGVNQQVMTFSGTQLPSAPGGFTGWLDEVRLQNGPKQLAFVMSAPVDATVTTIPMASVSGMDPEGGAILVGNELIGYAGFDSATNELTNCKRGFLNTTPAVHEAGDRVFNLAFLAVAALTAGVGAGDKNIPCDPNGFPNEGYAWIEGELVGYTWLNNGLNMPAGCDFRGAFGTTAAPHNQYDLVYAFPFRYWDRFTQNSDDNKLAWFGASHRATGAVWRRLTYEEWLPNQSVDIRVNARFNQEPRWIVPATNAPYVAGKGGGIWYFPAPTGGALNNVKADGIEIKVEFVWNDGAYSRGEWKESPQFRGLLVEYEQEPVTHYHEER